MAPSGRLVAFLKVLLAFDRREDVQAHELAVSLVEEVVLAEDLDRAIARAVNAHLRSAEQPVAQLETDLCSTVEAERIGEEIAEVAAPQRPREAMREAERPLAPWAAAASSATPRG